MNISKCTSEWELNANIRVVYVEKYFETFSRSKLINAMYIKLVVVTSKKPVPQRPDQNEQGQKVRYGLLSLTKKTHENHMCFPYDSHVFTCDSHVLPCDSHAISCDSHVIFIMYHVIHM